MSSLCHFWTYKTHIYNSQHKQLTQINVCRWIDKRQRRRRPWYRNRSTNTNEQTNKKEPTDPCIWMCEWDRENHTNINSTLTHTHTQSKWRIKINFDDKNTTKMATKTRTPMQKSLRYDTSRRHSLNGIYVFVFVCMCAPALITEIAWNCMFTIGLSLFNTFRNTDCSNEHIVMHTHSCVCPTIQRTHTRIHTLACVRLPFLFMLEYEREKKHTQQLW